MKIILSSLCFFLLFLSDFIKIGMIIEIKIKSIKDDFKDERVALWDCILKKCTCGKKWNEIDIRR